MAKNLLNVLILIKLASITIKLCFSNILIPAEIRACGAEFGFKVAEVKDQLKCFILSPVIRHVCVFS